MTFQVLNGRLNISDSLYFGERFDFCVYDLPARKGRWDAHIVTRSYGQWGERVSEFICRHQDADKTATIDTLISDDIGNDAATVCVYESEEGISDAHESYDSLVAGPHGACSTSGIGDGDYRAYGLYDGEELVAVRLLYISDVFGRWPAPVHGDTSWLPEQPRYDDPTS
ncbi:MAG: hypothetical protein GIW95_09090 [Candidatus Eremiobacteraeota bacterium]|nr:hypothetical protein [Candidatus Eremiobacteraeota bacterium]